MNEDRLEKSETRIDSMTTGEFDELGFSAVHLNGQGKIMQHGCPEGQLARLDPKGVISKNFFRDVSPCRHAGVRRPISQQGQAKSLCAIFRYCFVFKRQRSHNFLLALLHGRDWESTRVLMQAV